MEGSLRRGENRVGDHTQRIADVIPRPLVYFVMGAVTVAWFVGYIFSIFTAYIMNPQLHQAFITMVVGLVATLGISGKKEEKSEQD